MNTRFLELAKQAGLKKEHGCDREYIGDFDWRVFAELIYKDIITVVAAQALLNESALDVFKNLKNVYEE